MSPASQGGFLTTGPPGKPISTLLKILFPHRSVLCLVTQSCPTLCDPTDCSPPGLLCPRDSPGKNTRVDCHFLLQGFFLIQGLNPGLLHSRQILYHLSYRAVPDYTTFSKCGPQSPEGPQVAESCPNHAFEGKGAESQILDECVQECNF